MFAAQEQALDRNGNTRNSQDVAGYASKYREIGSMFLGYCLISISSRGDGIMHLPPQKNIAIKAWVSFCSKSLTSCLWSSMDGMLDIGSEGQ